MVLLFLVDFQLLGLWGIFRFSPVQSERTTFRTDIFFAADCAGWHDHFVACCNDRCHHSECVPSSSYLKDGAPHPVQAAHEPQLGSRRRFREKGHEAQNLILGGHT